MKHSLSISKTAISFLIALSSMHTLRAEQTDSTTVRYGVSGFSVNFMREAPGFTQELGNQILMGTPVRITGSEGYWFKVVSPEPYTAWCVDMGIVEMDKEEMADYMAAPKYIVTAEYSHVVSEPDTGSRRLSDLVAGDLLRKAVSQKAAKAGNAVTRKGYAEVLLPSGEQGYVKKTDIMDFRAWAESREATGKNIIRTAYLFLGIPYQWGGTSIKGVDCSGFTRIVWFMNGVLLPRNANQQAETGIPIPYPDKGKDTVSKESMLEFTSALEPGDLVFFGEGESVGHVGIYIGEGRFIHASQKVRISSLIPGEPDFYENSYRLMHACRVIGQEDKGTGVTSISRSPAYFPQGNIQTE